MRREIRIRTPENVEFGYRLAGVGSRVAAGIVDYLIIAFLVGVLASGFSLAALVAGVALPGLGAFASSGMVAILLVSIFLSVFGYFLFFELVWNGQTPGKRALSIRVVKDLGQGISFGDALVRNLVRVADIVPGLYGVGLISIFLSPRNKRIGDYAAGTLVITAERTATPRPFQERWERHNSLLEDAALAARIRSRITPEETVLARDAWARRESLAPLARVELMARVAGHLRERMELTGMPFLSDEHLVKGVLEVLLREERVRG